jgi:hypothetical protein
MLQNGLVDSGRGCVTVRGMSEAANELERLAEKIRTVVSEKLSALEEIQNPLTACRCMSECTGMINAALMLERKAADLSLCSAAPINADSATGNLGAARESANKFAVAAAGSHVENCDAIRVPKYVAIQKPDEVRPGQWWSFFQSDPARILTVYAPHALCRRLDGSAFAADISSAIADVCTSYLGDGPEPAQNA